MGVSVAAEGAAVVVTLRWPERRNALRPEDAGLLADAIARAASGGASALVLTGEGAFCAGGDLRTFAAISAAATEQMIFEAVYGSMRRVIAALRACPLPTVAAVDGAAVGLGMDYALACDMRFIGPDGWLQQGWARVGLIPGVGGVGLLQRLNPMALWRIVGSQERLDAAACASLGLAEPAAPTALAAAVQRAESFRSIPRPVLRQYCRLSRQTSWPSEAHFRESARVQAGLIASDEFRDRADELLGHGGGG